MFIQTIRPSNKLDFAKLKFFKILKVLELITYKMDLPDNMRIIRIRYILVLKLADPEASLMEDMPDIDFKSQEKVWEIKKIIDLKLIDNNERKYLVK